MKIVQKTYGEPRPRTVRCLVKEDEADDLAREWARHRGVTGVRVLDTSDVAPEILQTCEILAANDECHVEWHHH
jgi:hypothetical protein